MLLLLVNHKEGTMRIRVRNLTARCTEEIEDTYPEGVPSDVLIGRTFVEASEENLLDIADQLRSKEAWCDHSSDNVALQEQSLKNAEAALERWAKKIEDTLRLRKPPLPATGA